MLDTLENEENPKLFHSSVHAKIITRLQEQMVSAINRGQFDQIMSHTNLIDDLLKDDNNLLEINEEQKVQVLALCYKQVNHLTDGKFLEHMAKVAAEELAAAQPGWGVYILSLLLKPIEWVLSLFKSSSHSADENKTLASSHQVARYKQSLLEPNTDIGDDEDESISRSIACN
jgi:hypothetical protein